MPKAPLPDSGAFGLYNATKKFSLKSGIFRIIINIVRIYLKKAIDNR